MPVLLVSHADIARGGCIPTLSTPILSNKMWKGPICIDQFTPDPPAIMFVEFYQTFTSRRARCSRLWLMRVPYWESINTALIHCLFRVLWIILQEQQPHHLCRLLWSCSWNHWNLSYLKILTTGFHCLVYWCWSHCKIVRCQSSLRLEQPKWGSNQIGYKLYCRDKPLAIMHT